MCESSGQVAEAGVGWGGAWRVRLSSRVSGLPYFIKIFLVMTSLFLFFSRVFLN